MENDNKLQSIQYKRGVFAVLDQLKVPHLLVYRNIQSVHDAVDSIVSMQVRGAPLIAMVGCMSLAVEIHNGLMEGTNNEEFLNQLNDKVSLLIAARPTAVNMKKEGEKLMNQAREWSTTLNIDQLKDRVITYTESLLEQDLKDNKAIGQIGAEAICANLPVDEKAVVLTHCNTGSLATCGHGTALGVVRTLQEQQKLDHVYFTETRPYNQGARLTAFELLHEKIPSTLICDSSASWLMKNKNVSAIVVGADRVARNGDTANKIGTYQLAVSAKTHNVPFYIAAPFSSIDPNIPDGDSIKIEERAAEEVTTIAGVRVAAPGVNVWNPGFDVTPAVFITGIITEVGLFTPHQLTNQF